MGNKRLKQELTWTATRTATQKKPMRKTEERKKKPSGGFISSSAAAESRVGSGRDGLRAAERGSGSRRVSRSPERRSETTNPNNGIGSSVNSSNNNNIPAKFVSVPATDKEKRSSNNNADASIKRVAVKRNVASPRSQSPARAASPRAQSPARVINHS
ncbi:unnamed protein product [Brassica rapa]|uniref:Uncharacterized protein n=1 Tax=Brassica campestris TaxID=3711 RepID=A0A3P6ALM4_BRACM|nr:unnamed protein product [Brassica rapa]VDC88244.1 unnamed protein product [Brassica rapa]